MFSALNAVVPVGSLLRVSGANGAGKTSLLRTVCGLLKPVRGEVLWGGAGIDTLREDFYRQLVYIGHSAALKDDLTAAENLLASARLSGANPSEAQTADALAAAGLRGQERAPVRALSQGQRKRVALARLMVSSGAPLWVLDEPFNALDTVAVKWLARLLGAHLDRGGIVLLTSHLGDLPLSRAMPCQELAL